MYNKYFSCYYVYGNTAVKRHLRVYVNEQMLL